jgi:hypothetical protein
LIKTGNELKYNDKQIIKNYQSDIETNMFFTKSLKYIENKNIPYEYVFSLLTLTNESIKGLPLYIVFSNLIEDYEFI